MRYTLALLTHGDHADWVEQTIDSFVEHVTPSPTKVVAFLDAAAGSTVAAVRGLTPDAARLSSMPFGFAGATHELWEMAIDAEQPYVFWLEHDFLVTRPVDLVPIAETLEANPYLAQMALYRGPVTHEEHAAGGYLNQRAELFERKPFWFEQQSWWTTNPSLMRTRTMQWNPWPDLHDCEVEAAHLALTADPSRRFGVWGHGETHVQHIGYRDGIGY